MFGCERDVDPFNAGEPEPIDDLLVDEGDYGPHGSGEESHKRPDAYKAPTTRADGYDAPSIEDAGTDDVEAARPGNNRLGCLIGFIVFFVVFGQLILGVISCTSTMVEGVLSETSVESYDYDSSYDYDDDGYEYDSGYDDSWSWSYSYDL